MTAASGAASKSLTGSDHATSDRFAATEAPASGLGDLANGEVPQIQQVVDEAGRPLEVAGSVARGRHRNPVPYVNAEGKRLKDSLSPARPTDVLVPAARRGASASG